MTHEKSKFCSELKCPFCVSSNVEQNYFPTETLGIRLISSNIRPASLYDMLLCIRNLIEFILNFLLANVNVHVRYMLTPVRPSVCRLSVTLVHPTKAVEIFDNISTAFGTLAIR